MVIKIPCKRYWEAMKKGQIKNDLFCPLVNQLCLHPNVEYFPPLECQRAYLDCLEKSPDQLKDELSCLIKNRTVVWGD